MIAYFDTSAFIPLVIDEPVSAICLEFWNEATRAVSVRILYPEARAALARAQRMGRLSRRQLTAAVEQLDVLVDQLDCVEITESLARAAGEMAEVHQLRGYDAVHLAAAEMIGDGDTVFVSGDQRLLDAVARTGLAVALAR
ncbi:type II toxin-antitoxin system VapC family toxin [Candidatus Poriferisodalis sp.]|uniref:type II toxin-antitoxin system VapC family toxin n=1 Tax=Candidatus Poriferisodalis sp. TaxID=3101277 RepID=UPI003AF64E79